MLQVLLVDTFINLMIQLYSLKPQLIYLKKLV